MVYELDPLTDARWVEFVERETRASAFHTPGWLGSLHDTYGFVPSVVTTSPPKSELKNGIAFCRVYSWITGRRLVSLPYSDHCEPIIDAADLEEIIAWVAAECGRSGYRYVEMRPLRCCLSGATALRPSEKFIFHSLDLHPDKEAIFAALDKKCVQNRIRHATKEELAYEAGRSDSLLASFYHLMVLTRQTHRLPPQPIQWYRNLIRNMGEAVTLHLLRKGDQAIAGILTVGCKHCLIAKYSCADQRFKSVGATPLLFWKVIEYAKRSGFMELDLGRCNLEDEGLATFKARLGAGSSELVYWRSANTDRSEATHGWKVKVAKQLFSCMPQYLLAATGRVLYKHLG